MVTVEPSPRLAFLAVVSAVTVVAACGPAGAKAADASPADPLLSPAPTVRAGSDDVTLLRGGQATFARIRASIEGARASIHVEMYEFNRRDLAGALITAHRRGVLVTVIDDPSESSNAATESRLRNAGIDVIDYPVRKLMIDHVKLLIVDETSAIIGGINWGARSPANHDYDALLHGPAVRNLERVFARDLVTSGRFVHVPDPVVDADVIVAATLPGAEIRPIALDLINQARHSLDLELFDLTDTSVVHALQAAHAGGVRVHVLLDPSQHSNAPAAVALQTAGIEVREYRSHGELLHAKAVVADAASLLFGSANWSGGGFIRNHEVDVEIPNSPVLAQQMRAQMTLDWDASAG